MSTNCLLLFSTIWLRILAVILLMGMLKPTYLPLFNKANTIDKIEYHQQSESEKQEIKQEYDTDTYFTNENLRLRDKIKVQVIPINNNDLTLHWKSEIPYPPPKSQ